MPVIFPSINGSQFEKGIALIPWLILAQNCDELYRIMEAKLKVESKSRLTMLLMTSRIGLNLPLLWHFAGEGLLALSIFRAAESLCFVLVIFFVSLKTRGVEK
jgi:hypothetical protein